MDHFIKQNKTTSYPNIGSLNNAIEDEWNKMPEKIILKAYKSFQMRVDRIAKKIAALLNKLNILGRFSYFVIFLI